MAATSGSYRQIDFRRDKIGIPGKVAAIEYDPNRSSLIALVVYKDGEKRYILAPEGLTVGKTVLSGPDAGFDLGNALPLGKIPLGMLIHNIELNLGRGGQMARSAGTSAMVVAKEGEYVTLAASFRGNAPGQREVLRHHRRARQQGPHERVPGQSGALALAGTKAQSARNRHEPCGPSARRR